MTARKAGFFARDGKLLTRDKLRQMQDVFLVQATKYNVFPLDNSVVQRALTPRPSATAGRDTFAYSGEIASLDSGSAPAY